MTPNTVETYADEVHVGDEEPGNGSRYVYCIWRVNSQWFAAFPDFHASSRIGSGWHHPDYVQEKMKCSRPDAEAMTNIINRTIPGAGFALGEKS